MRFLLSLTTLAIALSPSVALAAFSDVSPSYPYKDAIDWVQDQGIATGYSDGTFRPDAPINRVELLKIAVGANFVEAETRLCDPNHIYNFPDASRDNWYARYLCAAVQNKIVEGYPDGSFRPDQPVTYVEAAKIIGLAWKHLEHLHADKVPFPAVKAGAPWYEVYVRHLQNNDAVPPTILENGQLLTRGEMASIIYSLGSATSKEDRWGKFTDINGNFTIDFPARTQSDDPSHPYNILYGKHVYYGEKGAWELAMFSTADLLPGESWPDLARRIESSAKELDEVSESDRGDHVVYLLTNAQRDRFFRFVVHDDIALMFLFDSGSTTTSAIQSSLKFLD